ncbi:T9SS type A sorting domain-containing protein [Brumimicrobium glaciale]|uniref:T9SS type A sorting domain-containing protein n=2 Tax=Brumimicrobium glaciale TaxID=200475 RepID=A0A4Q4KPE9_9FLAO|nr:T9SS type A sorting domain-containing protein [Brumimicrobium glaciale]
MKLLKSQTPIMVSSLYISDPNFTEQFTLHCDSAKIYFDDTAINPLKTNKLDMNDFTVNLYPNPGREDFTISFSQSEIVNNITIYSSDGKIITELPPKGNTLNVKVNSWAKGVYYIKLNGDSLN